jgi:soluble lytic murein transglycosylase-like protein
MRLLISSLVICAGVAAGSPIRAQIVRVVDEHGHEVYVNGAASARPSRLTRKVKRANPAESAPRLAPGKLNTLVGDAARRQRLDPALVHAVIHAESGGNAAAISGKGAQGLMQLMPRTAGKLGVADVLNPASNIEGGRAIFARAAGALSWQHGGIADGS